VSLLKNISVDNLSPAHLWSALDISTRTEAVHAMYEGDRETRDQADHAVATALSFRLAGVRKLALDRRIDYFLRRVHPDNGLASTLLTTLHLGHRQPMLGTFLDALEIPNDHGLIGSDYEISALTTSQLEVAVAALRAHHDDSEVDVYLASLLALDRDVWGGLAPVIEQTPTT